MSNRTHPGARDEGGARLVPAWSVVPRSAWAVHHQLPESDLVAGDGSTRVHKASHTACPRPAIRLSAPLL